MKNSTPVKQPVLSYFFQPVLEQGADYYRRKKVVEQKLEAENRFSGYVSDFSGVLQTSAVNFTDDFKRIKSSECSCTVGLGCKHSAALAIACINSAEYREAYDKKNHLEILRKSPPAMTSPASRPHAKKSSIKPSLNEEAECELYEDLKMLSAAIERGDSSDSHFEKLQTPTLVDVANQLGNSEAKFSASIYSFLADAIIQVDNSKGHSSPQDVPETNYVMYVLQDFGFPAVDIFWVSNAQSASVPTRYAFTTRQILKSDMASVTDTDKAIASTLQKIADVSGIQKYSSDEVAHQMAELMDECLIRIVETGRARFRSIDGPLLHFRKMCSGRVAWRCKSEFLVPYLTAVQGEKKYELVQWNSPWYFDEKSGDFGSVNFGASFSLLKDYVSKTKLPFNMAEKFNAKLQELCLDSLFDSVVSADDVEFRLEKTIPMLGIELLRVKRSFTLAGVKHDIRSYIRVAMLSKISKFKDGELFCDMAGKFVYTSHNAVEENRYLERIESIGFQKIDKTNLLLPDDNAEYFSFPDANKWIEFSEKHFDELRNEGWQFDFESDISILPVEIDNSNFVFEVKEDEGWWLSLKLDIEVAGIRVALLPILLGALQSLPDCEKITADTIAPLNKGGKFNSYLPDGRVVRIPFARISNILLTLGEFILRDGNKEVLRISAHAAAELSENNSLESLELPISKTLRDKIAGLRHLKNMPMVEAPSEFNALLRPYQLLGLSWLQGMARAKFGGILADDMGLGKTIQVLAHIAVEKEKQRLTKPFLVVCPTSVLPNWLSEAKKFAPQLKVHSHHGADRESSLKNIADADLVVSTYPLLLRDEFLRKFEWHGIALDESQAIKNASSGIAMAACELKADQRFCITGTPVENHLGELWSQFRFLTPELLGTRSVFEACVRKPIEKDSDHSIKSALSQRIRPFVLRRTKNEVAKELPEKTKIVRLVELVGRQRDLYETVRLSCSALVQNQINQQGFKNSQINILSALQKLRQVCCDPRLVKLEAAVNVTERAKLDLLSEMLTTIVEEGRKVLVFSQYTSMLDLIAQELNELGFPFVQLRGDTKDRVGPVREFQEGSTQIFLLSLKAGGSGLNLTAADTVIHYDPWWNPAAEEQATDRAHRIGQKKNVFVYKLIVKGTIEERMLELQEQKRNISRGLFDEQRADSISVSLTEKDIERLLRPIEEIG